MVAGLIRIRCSLPHKIRGVTSRRGRGNSIVLNSRFIVGTISLSRFGGALSLLGDAFWWYVLLSIPAVLVVVHPLS